MAHPCIVVAGMGRCGTSLTMQMLDAGGIPCVGRFPDYETDAGLPSHFDAKHFARMSDCAIKLIGPANLPIGGMPDHVVIWLDRDPREQAKSQVKMASLLAPIDNARRAIRLFEKDLRKSRAKHRAAVCVPGGVPSVSVSFEGLLAHPSHVAKAIADFLAENGWRGLDVSRMARQVRPRAAQCFPGFMEEQILASRRLAA